MTQQPIQVIGGGLAGTEAAWQIAQAGVPVILHEMRPKRFSPAHHTENLAELVCSNSFGAMASDRAPVYYTKNYANSVLLSSPKQMNTQSPLVGLWRWTEDNLGKI